MARRRKVEGGEDLKRLERRLADVARRSPWSAYVMKNFDELSDMIRKYGAHWDEIAKWAIEEGHASKEGLSPDAARKAYERERERLKKLAASPSPVRASLPVAKSPVRMLPVTNLKPPGLQPTDADETLDVFRKNMRSATTYGEDKK